MITVDFTLFVSLLLSFSLLLVFGLWIRYNFFRDQEIDDQTHFLQQCPYCTYIFFDYHNRRVKTCPKCKSLLSPAAK